MNERPQIMYAFGFISILLLAIAIGLAIRWRSPPQQMACCMENLNKFIAQSNDEEIFDSVKAAIGEESEWPGVQVTHIAQLIQLQTAFVEKIGSARYKAEIYQLMAKTAAKLDAREKGMEFLLQGLNAAKNVRDENIKSHLSLGLLTAARKLGAKQYAAEIIELTMHAAAKLPDEQARSYFYSSLVSETWEIELAETDRFTFLTQVKTAADSIGDEQQKTYVYGSLARAAGLLRDPARGFVYLAELKAAADRLNGKNETAYIYENLATGAGGLGDLKQRIAFLEQLKSDTDRLPVDCRRTAIYENINEAYAQLNLAEKSLASLQQALDTIEAMPKAHVQRINPYLPLITAVESLRDHASAQGLVFLGQIQSSVEASPLDDHDKSSVYDLLVKTARQLNGDQSQNLALIAQLQSGTSKLDHNISAPIFYQELTAFAAKANGFGPAQTLLAHLQTAVQRLAVDGVQTYVELENATARLSNATEIPGLSASDKTQGLILLTQLEAAAQQAIPGHKPVYSYRVLAKIAGQLGERDKGFTLLMHTLNADDVVQNGTRNLDIEQWASIAKQLGASRKAAEYLKPLQTAAEKINNTALRIVTYKDLAVAANILDETNRCLELLVQALNDAVALNDEWQQGQAYESLVVTIRTLNKSNIAETFLNHLQAAAEKMPNATSLQSSQYHTLSYNAEMLGLPQKAAELSRQAVATAMRAEDLLEEESIADLFLKAAIANAKTGDYRYACNLVNNSKKITPAGALTILAAVLREYAKTHPGELMH